MKLSTKFAFPFFIALLPFILFSISFAAVNSAPLCTYIDGFLKEVTNPTAAVIFVLMMIWAGITYAAGGANQDSIKHAKDILTVAIGGMLLYLLMFFVMDELFGKGNVYCKSQLRTHSTELNLFL